MFNYQEKMRQIASRTWTWARIKRYWSYLNTRYISSFMWTKNIIHQLIRSQYHNNRWCCIFCSSEKRNCPTWTSASQWFISPRLCNILLLHREIFHWIHSTDSVRLLNLLRYCSSEKQLVLWIKVLFVPNCAAQVIAKKFATLTSSNTWTGSDDVNWNLVQQKHERGSSRINNLKGSCKIGLKIEL